MAQRGHRTPAALPADLDGVLGRNAAGLHETAHERVYLLVLVVKGVSPKRSQRAGIGGVEDDLRPDGTHGAIIALGRGPGTLALDHRGSAAAGARLGRRAG